MTIDEILCPADVNLALHADTKAAAIEAVLSQLRGDNRVANWEEFRHTVIEQNAPTMEYHGRSICIAHGRTKTVSELAMAAGRSVDGIICPETKLRVNLFFVVGIPLAMDSEYLRLIGAIVRVCRNSKQMAQLLSAPNSESFIECLSSATAQL